MSLQLVEHITATNSPLTCKNRRGCTLCKSKGSSVLICTTSIMKYDVKTKKCSNLTCTNIEEDELWRYSMIVVNNKLFLIGDGNIYIRIKGKKDWIHKHEYRIPSECCVGIGISGKQNKKFIHILRKNIHLQINPRNYKSKVITKCDMPYIEGSSMIEYDNEFYIFGGCRYITMTTDYFASVHLYNIKSKQWSKNIGCLPAPRAYHTTVGYHNFAIIIGGMCGNSHSEYDDIIVYNLETMQSVQQFKLLPFKITHATAIMIGHEIHQFGGCAYKQSKKNKWQTKDVQGWNDHIVITLKDLDNLFVFGYLRIYFNDRMPHDLILSILTYYR